MADPDPETGGVRSQVPPGPASGGLPATGRSDAETAGATPWPDLAYVGASVAPVRIGDHIPPHVSASLGTLWGNGHAAYVVGGSLRDLLLGRHPADWDIATDARPERIQELFPGSHYENRFGTVIVVTDVEPIEVTTFRRDHDYGDHRRPDIVTFSESIEEDLLRRDFTVNALAWGTDAPSSGHEAAAGQEAAPRREAAARDEAAAGQEAAPRREAAARHEAAPRDAAAPRLIDVVGGAGDLERGLLRAVGDPELRFDEDALRLVRAARLASQLGFTVEPTTLAAMRQRAELVAHVSHERVGQELRKLLRSPRPSVGLRLLADTGLLKWLLPELEAQQGLPQAKTPGLDCWEHTLATVDAAALIAPHDEVLAMAALFHDVGKPSTFADGHFRDHQRVGAEIAGRILRQLTVPHGEALRVARLIRLHMFRYDSRWGDVAVRQFIREVGPADLEDVLRLREADNVGSGVPRDDGSLTELRARVAREMERGFPLTLGDLAIDGDDLKRELGVEEGPLIGVILERLLHSAVSDPARNTRRQALIDAKGWLPELERRPAGAKPSGS